MLTTGIVITQNVGGLTPDTVYHWRIRLLYRPGNRLRQHAGRWIHIPWNGWDEADFRTPFETAVAGFYATPTSGAVPLTVTFTNTSTGASVFLWNFGDGQSSTLENPVYVYTATGFFTVSLTAYGATQDTLTRTAYIHTDDGLAQETVIRYTYDPLYRLTSASYSGAYTYTFAYAYDQIGNRTAMTRTITSTLVTTYTYDAANRLTNAGGVAYTWNANGNLLADGNTTYAYDFANRLTNVTADGLAWSATYNGDGARLRQIVNGLPTTYTLDLAAPLVQVLVQQDSSGLTRYLYGVTRVGEQQSAGWVYHLPDALGSVRQLADSDAQVVLTRGYMPYGETLWSAGEGGSAYGFTGEAFDASVGLVFLRARYMQPRLGVFLSRDLWVGYDQMPGTHNGFNYASGNPVNLTDPAGLQSLPGVLWFSKCFDLHTATPFFGFLGIQDSTTAGRAVEICKAAYSASMWDKNVPVLGFQLGQELPTTAHELFGWFVHDWRGRYNSDRLCFDANQPLTLEVLKTTVVNRVRHGYYAGNSDVGGPTHYEFDPWSQFLALLDLSKSLGQGSASISMFMGSFWYQVKTLPNDRVGFRIDNDTTLSSGSHVVGRFKGYRDSVEELIEGDPSLANKPLQEILRDPERYPVISILENRTRGQTGGRGGGNLYQTYYWTEKRACTWGEVWFGDHEADMQVWEWGDFKSRTVDPLGWPAQ